MPKSVHNLQLKTKFLLILSIAMLLLVPPFLILYLYILFPAYDEIEKSIIKTNMKRVLGSILNESTHIDNICYVWVLHYDIDKVRNIRSKTAYQSFKSGGFDFLCFIDSNKKVIFSEGYDTATGAKRLPAVYADTGAIKTSGILDLVSSGRHRVGMVRTEYGFMIMSVRPLKTGISPEKNAGYLMMGKYLDNLASIVQADAKDADFNIMEISGSLSPLQGSALVTMQREKRKGLILFEANTIYIYFLIPDIYGNDTILIEEALPSIIKDARRLIRTSLLMGIIGIPVLIYLIWFLLGHYVLKPVNKLKTQIRTIADGNYKNISRLQSKDEIGMLSLFIDNMAQTISSRSEDLKSANRKLELLTITDGLTGIYNRRHFDDIIRSEWNRAVRSSLPLSVIMCDIDFFKKYNDMYGHQAGDECLIMIARALKGMIRREGDKVFRYGGEEFIAILPNTPPDAAVQIALSFLAAVTRLNRKHEHSPDYGIVTLSAGVSSAKPDKDSEPGYLIGLADGALYKSKQNGRNIVTYAASIKNREVIYTEHIFK
ncbi:MAG: diguanylate cyclase [Spirochaetes bacterium]|nr:diguanylate cyclase [Spirochaetota bacterium]